MNQRIELPLLTSTNFWRFLWIGCVYALVWTATWYSARLLAQLGGASLWFLPAGLRFTAIFFLGWRGFLLELLTVWAVSAADFLAAGGSYPDLLSSRSAWMTFQWLSPVVGYALVLLPVRTRLNALWDFKRPEQSTLFLGTGLVCAALAAWGGSFGLAKIGVIEASQVSAVWAGWLVGDFIGIVTLAPLLLVWVCPRVMRYVQGVQPTDAALRRPSRRGLVVATLGAALMSLLLVFGIPYVLGLSAELPFFVLLLFLPLVGLSLRFGLRGALLAVVVLDSGLAVLVAATGHGDSALRFQLVMLAMSVVGLWLGGVVEARQLALQRYRDFSYASNDLLWEVDRNGHLRNISGRLARYMAVPVGQHWRDLLSRGEPKNLEDIEGHWVARKQFRHLELALHSPGHGTRWIQLNGQPVWNFEGDWVGFRGTALDVSRARRARMLMRSYNQHLLEQVAARTQELHNSARHLQVVLAAAPVAVLELDARQRCCLINDRACLLTGWTRDLALGQKLLNFVHPDDRDRVVKVWNVHQDDDGVHNLELRLDRTARWCSLNWIHLRLGDDAVQATILALTDITDQRHHQELLWSLAHHDPLTNLPNRSLFRDRCEQALNLAKRNRSCAAIMWLDLDGFKEVNDTLGHAAGDQLLKEVAGRLRSRVRDVDTVARMGGDEFAIALSGVSDAEQAEKMAAEVVKILARPFQLQEGPATVTASVGLALYPQDADTLDALIRRADMAMYAAKRGGKNKELSWRHSGLSALD